MSYYRITYDGYIEGEYDSEEEAREDMVSAMQEDIESGKPFLTIETFNEESGEWE